MAQDCPGGRSTAELVASLHQLVGLAEDNDLRDNGKGGWRLPPDGAPLLKRVRNEE